MNDHEKAEKYLLLAATLKELGIHGLAEEFEIMAQVIGEEANR